MSLIMKLKTVHLCFKLLVLLLSMLCCPVVADTVKQAYHDALIIENGRPSMYQFYGGYCSLWNKTSKAEELAFHYYTKDHLGNNREVVSEDGTVEQVTNYYPFGTPYSDHTAKGVSMQKYKYNGKELDLTHGLNTYDYGARQYYSVLLRWDRLDPLCEKYYHVSPYVYCMNNPVNSIDTDGRSVDWYKDKDGTFQYSPNVHSQKDLTTGQRYIGKSFTTGKGHNLVQYRTDGSILYNNETVAYNRMWNQADVHYRNLGEKGGREAGGFILSSGKVLVLPEYLNDFETSDIEKYGYHIHRNGTVTKGKETFSVLANIHTHQKGSGDPTPSVYGSSDARISERMGARPVYVMGHDGKIHGVMSDQNRYSVFQLPNPYGSLNKLLKGQVHFSTYTKNIKWILK